MWSDFGNKFEDIIVMLKVEKLFNQKLSFPDDILLKNNIEIGFLPFTALSGKLKCGEKYPVDFKAATRMPLSRASK